MPEPSPKDETRRAGRHAPAIVRFAVAVIVLLGADLASKSLAFAQVAGTPVQVTGPATVIPPHDTVIVVPKVLGLQLTINIGAVFGLGGGLRWMFVAFSLVATAVLIHVFRRSGANHLVLHLALAAVLAGALGNLYDRVIYGVVRDMLWLFPGVDLPFGWRWPDGSNGLYPWIFNIADVCLVLGLIVLMVIMHRHDRAATRAKA